MTRPPITGTRNPQLKAVRRLRRSRAQGRSDVFLAEGHRQLACALAAGAHVLEVYSAPQLYLGDADCALVRLAERRGARVIELGTDAFTSISRQVRPDGLVAVVERWPTRLECLRAGSPVLVATGIERPGNLGAIVRTAEAAGALVVSDPRTDVFHPDSVRGSVGTIFHLPIAEGATPEVLAWLRRNRLRVIVATPGGESPHWDADYRGSGVAVVVGGERHGVAAEWLAVADETVRIPMCGRADSLNVAVAAGIVLFEAVRQRNETRR